MYKVPSVHTLGNLVHFYGFINDQFPLCMTDLIVCDTPVHFCPIGMVNFAPAHINKEVIYFQQGCPFEFLTILHTSLKLF